MATLMAPPVRQRCKTTQMRVCLLITAVVLHILTGRMGMVRYLNKSVSSSFHLEKSFVPLLMNDDDDDRGESYSYSSGSIALGSNPSMTALTDNNIITNCSDYLTTPTYQSPKRHSIPRSVAYLLHMGKASGGSVRLRTSRWWNLYMHECHIDPCERLKKKTYNQTKTTVLITIRDPIDRFVSAFYYASVMAGFEYDKRYAKECRHSFPVADAVLNNNMKSSSSQFCQLERMENYRILDRYDRNINNFAEALCGDPLTEAYISAKKDIHVMFHIRQSILDWISSIPGDDIVEKKKAVYPIVLEKTHQMTTQSQTRTNATTISSTTTSSSATFDLNAQIDDAMRRLLRKSQMVNDTVHREAYVKYKDCQVSAAEATAEQSALTKTLSKRQHVATQSRYYVPLDENKYTTCLVHFFQSDYHVIREMAFDFGNCRGNVQCQGALESIWNRRSPHLLL